MSTLNIILQAETGSFTDAKAIVFWICLALCVWAFFYFLKKTDKLIEERAAANNQEVIPDTSHLHGDEAHDEEAAAIALAISMYKSELHDQESFTITLQKVSRIYSPWSSKIYTLRQPPRK